MGIQRFSHFASNSMKIAEPGIKTSLTTETEALFEFRLFRAMAATKILATFRRGTAFVLAGAGLALPLRKGQEGGPEPATTHREVDKMFRKMSLALAATLIMAGAAWADPIEGSWKTQSGETATIGGGGSFSITLKTGKYAGKTIGSLKAAGDNKYAGNITDPANDKTYSGKATLTGTTLKMSGCVLGGLICKSQTWHKL